MAIVTCVETAGTVTVVVRGTMNATSVADFDRALGWARELDEPVVLDLSHVRLIDRPTLNYLIDLMQHDVQLVICPDFVERWICRESHREPIE